MNQPPASPPSRSLLFVFLPWLLTVLLAGGCWVLYAKFQEVQKLAHRSMDQEKELGAYLGNLCEEGKMKNAEMKKQVEALMKQVADSDATAATWREQFTALAGSLAESEKVRAELAHKLGEIGGNSASGKNQ